MNFLLKRIQQIGERFFPVLTIGWELEIKPDAFVPLLKYYHMAEYWGNLYPSQKRDAWNFWKEINKDFEQFFIDRFGDARELSEFIPNKTLAQIEAMSLMDRAVSVPFESLADDDQARLIAIVIGLQNPLQIMKTLPRIKEDAPPFLQAARLKGDGNRTSGFVFELASKETEIFDIAETIKHFFSVLYAIDELDNYLDQTEDSSIRTAIRPHFHLGLRDALEDTMADPWLNFPTTENARRLTLGHVMDKMNASLLLEKLFRLADDDASPLRISEEKGSRTGNLVYRSDVDAKGLFRKLHLFETTLVKNTELELQQSFLRIEIRDEFDNFPAMIEWAMHGLSPEGDAWMKARAQEIFHLNPSVLERIRVADTPSTKKLLTWLKAWGWLDRQ